MRHMLQIVAITMSLVMTATLAYGAAPSEADKRKAGGFYMEGERLFENELYSAAIENFKKAHAVIPVPANLYNIARSYEKLGDAVNCVKFYDEYTGLYKEREGREPPDIVDVRASIQKCRLLMKPEVSIRAEPESANVFINDDTKLLGQTPYKTTLDPGTYQLTLKKDGFQPFKTTFEVRAGEPIKLFFKMEKFESVGHVTVNSNIRGAQIFVDGRNVALTPYSERIALSEGKHQVTVDKDDYEPYRKEFTLKHNEELVIDSELYLSDSPMTWKGYVGWTALVLGTGMAVGGFFAGQHADTFFSDSDDFEQFELLQNVGYFGGGALAGAGVLLLILEAADSSAVKDGDEIGAELPAFLPVVGVTPDGKGGMVGADVRF